MGSRLLLVRHAMPLATDDVPPRNWRLTDDGQLAADRLRSRLPSGSYLVSSNERRAWETLGRVADVTRDPHFNEVARDGEPWGGNFRELRRQYVDGVTRPGWEPHDLAAARFDAGVAEFRRRTGRRPLVIATHGMILTTWLVRCGAVAADEAGDFWSRLRFPDCIEVRPDGIVPVL